MGSIRMSLCEVAVIIQHYRSVVHVLSERLIHPMKKLHVHAHYKDRIIGLHEPFILIVYTGYLFAKFQ
jgi:hypothetical protein